jgi:2C-methyl-D-erythritol 2,4-cyclodiphosphate synthase
LSDTRVGIGYDSHRFEESGGRLVLGGVHVPDELLSDRGWGPVSADLTVVAERPRLGQLKEAMAKRLAGAIGVQRSCVNVKATSNERMGFIGRGEGIVAIAVAQIEREPDRAV